MTAWMRRQGHHVNHKRVRRLLRLMGLEAVYPRRKRGLSVPDTRHKICPYLLKDVEITRPDQVWSADITYIRMYRGWLYLVAVMDWFSRYVLSWEVSVTLESEFCVSALKQAKRPEKSESQIRRTHNGCWLSTNNHLPILPIYPINQFESIMQNKPNLLNAQMNVTSFYTVDYENEHLR